VLDSIAARTPLGDIRPHIEVERIITPADWEDSGVFFGATFNLAHYMTQMLYFRPHNKSRSWITATWLAAEPIRVAVYRPYISPE